MSIKNLVEMIKRNGLLASMPQLEELYQVAIENELKLAESQREFRAADAISRICRWSGRRWLRRMRF
ncbi:TPA: hypothetical protein PVD63_002489 [Escherichia coli]|nr:hypothetical protein [Escherichia coli]